MKRRDLIAHLKAHGCVLIREGARHSCLQIVVVPDFQTLDDLTVSSNLPVFFLKLTLHLRPAKREKGVDDLK